MNVLNIPKKMAQEDLVLIPRKKYEELLFREPRVVDDEPLTASEKRALLQARKDYKVGKTMSFDEFSKKLGFRNKR